MVEDDRFETPTTGNAWGDLDDVDLSGAVVMSPTEILNHGICEVEDESQHGNIRLGESVQSIWYRMNPSVGELVAGGKSSLPIWKLEALLGLGHWLFGTLVGRSREEVS